MAAGRTGSGSVVVSSGGSGGGGEVTFEEYVRCIEVLHDSTATRPARGLARRAVQHLRRACGWSEIVPAHKSPRVVALREKAAAHRMRQLTAVRHGYLCGRLRYETNVLVPFSPHDSFRSDIAPRRRLRRSRPQTRPPAAATAASLPTSPSPPPQRDFALSLPRSPRLAAAAAAETQAPPPPQRWQPSRASRRARLCVRKEERERRPTAGGDERPLLIGCDQRGRSVSSVQEQDVSGG